MSVSGGPNALSVLGILPGLAAPGYELTFLHVRRPGVAPGPSPLEAARVSVTGVPGVRFREVVAEDVARALAAESVGFDLAVVGASGGAEPITSPVLAPILDRVPGPVLVARARRRTPRCGRDGRHALVVAEGPAAGGLALEQALRWASAGSQTQAVLLGPGEGAAVVRGTILGTREFAHVSSVELVQEPLHASRIIEAIEDGGRDLVVLALERPWLGRRGEWVDDLFLRSPRPVLCAVAPGRGPGTRRHRTLASVVG